VLTFLLSLLVFAFAAAALGVGLVIDGRRLRGSCGRADDCLCDVLDARRCPKRSEYRRRETHPIDAVGDDVDRPPTASL
jgi:hypothetical protein